MSNATNQPLYYTLIGIIDGGDQYEILFGDYDREVVEVEREEFLDGGEYKALTIIRTELDQESINAGVERQQAEYDSRQKPKRVTKQATQERKVAEALLQHTGDQTSIMGLSELKELFTEIGYGVARHGESDFHFEWDGAEYRVIADAAIWEIYVESIQQLVQDCYEVTTDDLPEFIAVEIDWEQTAKNAFADGYGHTFASYDHDETERNGYWIFRTN